MITRRTLLHNCISLPALVAARPSQAAVTPVQFKEKLTGPICSVPTPYTERFAIDHAAIKRIVECGLKAGSHVFALTAGNSQYDRLTYEEIKALTSTLVQAVNGRGMVIGATGPWWTGQAVDYARFAESSGVDAVQVFLPAYGDEDMLFDHFREIAGAGKCAIVLHGQVPMPLLKRILTFDSIVAYKEEYPVIYSVDVFTQYGKRLNIFAGGQKSRYLMYQPYGMQAYYSTFSTFEPSVPKKFWQACERGDTPAAIDVVKRYDVPFFAKFSHPFWRATLETFGTASRFSSAAGSRFHGRPDRGTEGFLLHVGTVSNTVDLLPRLVYKQVYCRQTTFRG
ncbi:MAG: dihydrodipicolinate synthase family protein [Bryobacteraceae bacterium]